jgi:excisionase family DNA binding protein
VFLVFTVDDGEVSDTRSSEWLSTGAAARLLGASRQHVVDLCTRGTLPYTSTGTHRRVRRSDLEALTAGGLTREAERSLWLHRAVAGHLVTDPDAVLARAQANLARLQQVHASGMSATWLSQWAAVLDAGIDAVLDVLTSRSPYAVELRQNSPFAGALSPTERAKVAAAFTTHWRRDHAA